MKKWLWIIGIIFIAVAAFGQTGNTFYASKFPGKTVGQKVSAAQAACNLDSAISCTIVIGPTMSAFPDGTMPTKCAQCVWVDYRTGSPYLSADGGKLKGALTAPVINNVVNVQTESGSTADKQIAACFAALSAGGGTCDARGYSGSTQTIASTLTLDPSAPVTLVCDSATHFVPASTSEDMLVINQNVTLKGCTLSVSSSYSGDAITVTPPGSLPASSLVSVRLVDDRVINSAGATSQTSNTGTALQVNSPATAGTGAGYLYVSGLTSVAMGTCVSLSATAGGWVNDNSISNVRCMYPTTALEMTTDATSGSQVAGNNFFDWLLEAENNGGYKGTVISYDGSGNEQDNRYIGWQSWDFPTIVADNDANALYNFLTGQAVGAAPPSPTDGNFYLLDSNAYFGNVSASVGYSVSGYTAAPIVDDQGNIKGLSVESGAGYYIGTAPGTPKQIIDSIGNITAANGDFTGPVNSAYAPEINGKPIASTNLSDSASLARLSQPATFSSLAGSQSVTFTPLPAAGTIANGAAAACATGYTCTQMSGVIALTTGSDAPTGGGGDAVQITFPTALPTLPVCEFGGTHGGGYGQGSGGFSLELNSASKSDVVAYAGSALTASTTYAFTYNCFG